jgi:uncharacterized membrane protein YdbT with pleckstrin-like domain
MVPGLSVSVAISFVFSIILFINFRTSLTMIGLECLSIVLIIFNYYYQKQYIKTYYYNLTDKLLIIYKGILMPREITVPIGRIQDVYVDQDVFDRLFDLYDVHISTATDESTSRAHIDGVSKGVAEELRKLILGKLHHQPREQ